MNYSEVKAAFSAILNRRDITPSLITQFINLGLQHIQRKLRIPAMEELLEYETTGVKEVAIPGDLLELISIHTDDATLGRAKLERRDLQTVLRAAATVGTPRYFCRVGSNFYVGPVPAEGNTLYITYYADASALSADADTNWMTQAAPSLIIYAALKYAADHYLDDRKDYWLQTLAGELNDLQDMAHADELTGASMSPVYPDQIEAL